MLENQFIQFYEVESDGCIPVPLLQGEQLNYCTQSNFAALEIVDSKGNESIIPSNKYAVYPHTGGYKEVEIDASAFAGIGLGDCFKLREISERTEVSVQLDDFYTQGLCEDAEDPVAEGEVTLEAGDYTMVFENGLDVRGQWHHEEQTSLVDGLLHVFLIGPTKTIDAGYLRFENGQLINNSLSFTLTEDSALYMDISVINVDGSVPDCFYCDLWLYLRTTPPSFYKITRGKISNSMRLYEASDNFSKLRYICSEDAFGFPFHNMSNYPEVYLPIRIHSPQNVQEDKTYVKANGEVVTLFAKYYKEWEGETEYLSAEMHDKIVAALSCDYVYINGKRVTKSDKYQVDWENYDLDCDGVTKLARATFKVRENTNQRNSNF